MSGPGRIFGTDGIRGKANEGWLRPEGALHAGRVAGTHPLFQTQVRQCVVGRDTRRSGPMLTGALTAGLAAEGWDVIDAGVVPTPLLAWLAGQLGLPLALMVTASHNPAPDNGIKFFGSGGRKLTDAEETSLETFWTEEQGTGSLFVKPGYVTQGAEALSFRAYWMERWVDHLCASSGRPDFNGSTVVVDGAHGAMADAALFAFEACGAAVIRVGMEPDGDNINEACGCLHPETAAEAVIRHQAMAGVCFDGDGDRVAIIDESGAVWDGDDVLAVLAVAWNKRGVMNDKPLVATVMSNGGLADLMAKEGIGFVRAGVGDRQVLANMLTTGAILGGEQSGHFILADRNGTGDGLAAALEVLSLCRAAGVPLSELRKGWSRWPQRKRNFRLEKRVPLEGTPVEQIMKEATQSLGTQGRLLLRYSGTEPLLRLLVEGASAEEVGEWMRKISHVIEVTTGGVPEDHQ